jgi:valyl-tRNA synthetase
VREIRNRYQVDDKTNLDVSVKCSADVAADFNALAAFIGPLAKIAKLTAGPATAKPKQAGGIVRPEFEAYVSLVGLIDLATEIKRVEKEIADKQGTLAGVKAKLGNEGFMKNAKPEKVQEFREVSADLERQIAALEENLRELKAE